MPSLYLSSVTVRQAGDWGKPDHPLHCLLYTSVVMAAGMGSRYGGMKQIDPVGPNGQVIMDYSLYDASGP